MNNELVKGKMIFIAFQFVILEDPPLFTIFFVQRCCAPSRGGD